MNTKELQDKLNATEAHVMTLVEKYRHQQKRLGELEKENQELKESLSEQNASANDFQNTSDFAKIADYLALNGNGVVGLKEKIDEHIKDIEHCITFINRQL